jgi:hypothetical protein
MFSVILEHADGGLSLPLYSAANPDEVVAEWQSWGRVLGLPLLLIEDEGASREVFARIGRLLVGQSVWCRRWRTAIARRRMSRLLRRHASPLAADPVVYRGEREIIARE